MGDRWVRGLWGLWYEVRRSLTEGNGKTGSVCGHVEARPEGRDKRQEARDKRQEAREGWAVVDGAPGWSEGEVEISEVEIMLQR